MEHVSSYDDLAEYRVVTVLGRRSVEKKLEQSVPEFSTTSTEIKAFRMLMKGRIDVVVIDDLTGQYYANEVGIENVQLALLEQHPFHLLVHKSYAEYMPALEQALNQVLTKESLKKIIDEVVY